MDQLVSLDQSFGKAVIPQCAYTHVHDRCARLVRVVRVLHRGSPSVALSSDASSKANAETLRAYSCSHANDCCAALTYRHFYNCHGLLTLLWECSCSCVTVEQLLATTSEISTIALIPLWSRTTLPIGPSQKRGARVSQHSVDRRWILILYEGSLAQ